MLKLTLAFFLIACFVAAEAARLPAPYNRDPVPYYRDPVPYQRDPEPYQRDPVERFFKDYLHRRSCVALGERGCEANNAKCCRDGNPYTGTMRKCKNEGNFFEPKYVCRA
ncbi:uncharacterized protein LOC144666029 [Oculina patagonica]